MNAEQGPRPMSRKRYSAYVVILLCAVVLLYLLVGRGMQFFLVPTNSMRPTFQPQDYILTLTERQYQRGDLVVLQDPMDHLGFVVKRIVGVGGDVVSVENNALHIDGQYVSEPYLMEPAIVYVFPPYQVPEDHVFLLGDNRNQSDDSTNWPRRSVPEDTIVGKVRLIYLPLARMGRVSAYPLEVPALD